jgi:predicted GIY-YIG superfamily endonuclease
MLNRLFQVDTLQASLEKEGSFESMKINMKGVLPERELLAGFGRKRSGPIITTFATYGDNYMICYLVTHESSGKQYVGISNRDLATRRAEHESHSASSTFNAKFHSALREYGKDTFTWKVVADGEEEGIKILERVLINKWRTLFPKGFNSTNEASEFECPDEGTLSFFEEMDTLIHQSSEDRKCVNNLYKSLYQARDNPRLDEKTNDLIEQLFNILKEEIRS